MALKIRMLAPAAIKARVAPRLPVSAIGTNGLDATVSGGRLTVSPAYDEQVAIATLSAGNRDNTFALVYNSDDLTYKRLGMDVLLTSISAGLDPTLVSIAALTPTTDQSIYFSASDTAAAYSLTSSGRALGGLVGAADKVPYFTAVGAASTTDLSSFARTLIDDTTQAAARTTLGVGIGDSPEFTAVNIGAATDTTITRVSAGVIAVEGSNVLLASGLGSITQAYDAELAALAGLTSAADKLPYFTGAGTAAVADFSAYGRTLVDDADATTARSTLGLVIGTNVQAYHARLADISGITYAQGDILYHDGSNLVKLAKGTDGHFLKIGATIPAWAAVPGGGDLLAANNLSDLANVLTGLSSLTAPFNCGRLAYSSATALTFTPYNGDLIRIAGTIYRIPGAGIAGLANTSIYLNGVGSSNLSANTTYLVAAFNNGGTVTADFLTTLTHLPSTTAGSLGTEIPTGSNTRTVIGLVRTNGSSQFQMSVTNIGVLSWFNRRGLAGNAAYTANRTTTNSGLEELNTEIRVNFLNWADEIVTVSLNPRGYADAVVGAFIANAINFNGGAPTAEDATGISQAWTTGQMLGGSAITIHKGGLTEGTYHYTTMLGSTSSGTGTWQGGSAPSRTTLWMTTRG